MKHTIFGKALSVTLWLGGPIMATNALAQSQGGSGQGAGMMGAYGAGWMSGSGGIWFPLLFVTLVAGIVAWVIAQKSGSERIFPPSRPGHGPRRIDE